MVFQFPRIWCRTTTMQVVFPYYGKRKGETVSGAQFATLCSGYSTPYH